MSNTLLAWIVGYCIGLPCGAIITVLWNGHIFKETGKCSCAEEKE